MLRLMALDPAPSVYLGRPCYHGLAAPCRARRSFGRARYSARVLDSMAAALRSLLYGARALFAMVKEKDEKGEKGVRALYNHSSTR